jgi:hypothetical protein
MVPNALQRYRVHKAKAKTRGIGFLLTFDEWYDWWLSNGIDKNTQPPQSRTDPNVLCMCRINDTGPYQLGNIYCATRGQNSKDARAINPFTKRGANRHSARSLHTPNGDFKFIGDAAKSHGCTDVTIRNRMISKPLEYYFTDNKTGGKCAIQTPDGKFETIKKAAEFYKVHTSTIQRNLDRLTDWIRL